MWCATIVLLVLGFMAAAAPAAEGTGGILSGTVVDNSSGAPVADVNVFLANTMLGSSTDGQGHFRITGILPGSHELLVSHVGYVLDKRRLFVKDGQSYHLEIRIRPRVWQSPDIEVTARRDKRWKRQLSTFRQEFLGTSSNAARCRLLNPEVLSFHETKKKNTFTAEARDRLIIENRALGYRIDYLLQHFEAQGGLVSYVGFPKFSSLEASDSKELRLWRQNRKETFLSSARHFFRTFLANRHIKAGFIVVGVEALPTGDEIVAAAEIEQARLVSPGTEPFLRQVSFVDYLQITNTRATEAPEYFDWLLKQAGVRRNDRTVFTPKPQTSWIILNQPVAELDVNGNVINPFAMTFYGYWAWQRVADILPLEYEPEGDHIAN